VREHQHQEADLRVRSNLPTLARWTPRRRDAAAELLHRLGYRDMLKAGNTSGSSMMAIAVGACCSNSCCCTLEVPESRVKDVIEIARRHIALAE